ncbi:MAG: bifunctional nuclease family protein [Bacteroidetes bacterium]|nr:bifunctional nuclease family protein [Bacteroidota bacterium]
MNRVKVEIYGIAPSQIQGSYSLILAEIGGDRKVPVIIGQYEAQAIAIQLEGINTGRPLTHDLFLTFSKKFEIEILEVFIHKLKEGVFHSTLLCEQIGFLTNEIDSRTSDAIALAIRFNCPIYTTDEIFEEAGITIEDNSIAKPGRDMGHEPPQANPKSENKFKNKTDEQLEKMLDDALNNEDYMKAAIIRDELDKRA